MTRNTKISCDITREADNMLKAYCEKHERSKGFLIEKMIRTYCVEVEATEKAAKPVKTPVKRFKPPTVEDVREYCDSRCNKVDAEAFVDHYTTNGWVQGKNKPVKCWKACVRTWEKSDQVKQKQLGKTSGNLSACEDFING